MAAWRELWDTVVDVHCSWRENLVERNAGEVQLSGVFSGSSSGKAPAAPFFETSSAAPHAPQSTSAVHLSVHPARPSKVLHIRVENHDLTMHRVSYPL